MAKKVDIRFALEDGTDVASFINAIGMNLEEVIEAVVLENDGFAHLMPNDSTRQKFVIDTHASDCNCFDCVDKRRGDYA